MKQNGQQQQEHLAADVTGQRLARVYAEALLDTAEKKGQAEAVLDELIALSQEVFKARPEIEQFLASPAVPHRTKAAVLQQTFGSRAGQLFTDFLLVVNDHDRLGLVRDIAQAYHELYDQRARRLRVQVRSAVPLPDDQRQRLVDGLRNYFRLEPVLDERVEPELLGGLTVQVGDWLFDGTLRSEINNIRNQLIGKSSQEIQGRRDRFSTLGGA